MSSARERSLTLLPIAVSCVVLLTGWFPVAAVRDAATLGDVPNVYLARPDTYVDFAPFSDVLDAIALLSERQHVAVLLGLVAVWSVWRFLQPHVTRYDSRDSVSSFVLLLSSIAVLYAAAAYLPRPMAYLASTDPDVLRIDFHSHTQSSKDARRDYSVERNRAWHRAGGYDVAYVTDHRTYAGGDRALASDPQTGKHGVMLLRGMEANWRDEHVGVLGCCGTRAPIVVWNHPHDPQLKKLPVASGAVQAIEIANGAPQGMDLVRWKRQQILALARKDNLALLSGTDSHGWGFVAPNWTLLHLPGWRDLDREHLAAGIEGTLKARGFGATRVVERASADPGTSEAALAFSVFLVPWRMMTELSVDERRMWLVWIWAIAIGSAFATTQPVTFSLWAARSL